MINGLVELYVQQIQAIYGRIKKLYGVVNDTFMPEDEEPPRLTISPPNSSLLNRATYLWTLDEMANLQKVVDWIVGEYVEYSLVDLETGKEPQSLKLWQPTQIVIDDNYQNKLMNDFKAVNALLDQLKKNAEPYQKEA